MMFFDQMQNYFVFFIICGLWSTWNLNAKFKHRITFCSFLSILPMICCISSAYFFNIFYLNNSISNTISNILYTSVATTHLIIVFESIYQKDAQLKLIDSLSHADELLNSKSSVIIPYYKEKSEQFKRFVILVSMVAFLNINFLCYTYKNNLYYNFIYVSLYSYFMMSLRFIQIIFFVCLLRNRLISIIEELKDIQIVRRKFNQRNQRMELNSNNSTIDRSINERLFNLKQTYRALYEACEQINNAFGWSMFASSLEAFVEFTSNCYWAYMCMHEMTDFVIYLSIPEVLLLGVLSYFCSSCFKYVSQLNC